MNDRADRPNPRIESAEDQGVAAAVGNAPGRQPPRVDVGAQLEVRQSVAVVLDLHPGVDVLARFAAAAAEGTVVEDERTEAGLREHLGEEGLNELLDV